MQDHYNLIYREEEREMIPQCIDQGVGVIPWSPLARGVLAGTRTREGEQRTTRSGSDSFIDSLYTPDSDYDVVDRLRDIAEQRGVPPAQVALAWLLHRSPNILLIPGTSAERHLRDNAAAASLILPADARAVLNAVGVGGRPRP